MISHSDAAGQNGDPVTRFLEALRLPAASRCPHVDQLPSTEPRLRDLAQPELLSCAACVLASPASSRCGSCGDVEAVMLSATFARVDGPVFVAAVGLLCAVCAPLLPAWVETEQLGEDGGLGVNRPDGGAR